MSQDNNRLILQHLTNLNHLLDTFDETTQILQQHLRRNNSQSTNAFPNFNDIFNNVNQTPQNTRNNNRRRQNINFNSRSYQNGPIQNNTRTFNNNTNDDLTYVFRFDNLLPELINNLNRNSNSND